MERIRVEKGGMRSRECGKERRRGLVQRMREREEGVEGGAVEESVEK